MSENDFLLLLCEVELGWVQDGNVNILFLHIVLCKYSSAF